MKNALPVVLLILLTVQTALGKEAPSAPKWLFKSDGEKCYRIPGVITTGTTLIAVAERRFGSVRPSAVPAARSDSVNEDVDFNSAKCSDWGYVDIVGRRSNDGGKTWGEEQTLIDHRQFLSEPYEIALSGNPTPVDAGDRVLLLFVVSRSSTQYNGGDCAGGKPPGKCGEQYDYAIWMIESTDTFTTWTTPRRIDLSKSGSGAARVGPGHGIRLSNGELLMPGYPWLLKSGDGGQTWRTAAAARLSPLRGDETAVVELSPGTVWSTLRPNKKTAAENHARYPFRLSAYSSDWGETYESVEIDQNFHAPKVEAGAIRYRGDVVVSYPASGLPSSQRDPLKEKIEHRRNLTLAISSDNAKTWSHCQINSTSAGYSDMAETENGILLIYEGNAGHYLRDDTRQGIVYTTIPSSYIFSCDNTNRQ